MSEKVKAASLQETRCNNISDSNRVEKRRIMYAYRIVCRMNTNFLVSDHVQSFWSKNAVM
jgi:hypothetical protein